MSVRVPETIAWAMPSTSWSRFSRLASSEIARSRSAIVRVDSASRALPMAVAMWSANARATSVSSGVQAYSRRWYSTSRPSDVAAEHDRDEADRPDPGPPVDRPQPWQGRPEVAAQDLDLLVAERVHAGRLRIAWQGADDVEDLLREAALRDHVERGRAVVEHPQAGLVDAEQRERLVDDVAEQAVEVVPAADLGRDPAQRVGPRRALCRGCERGLVAG